MKAHKILAIVFALATGTAFGQQLTIVVKNVKEAKGTVRVGLFDTKDSFLKKPLLKEVVKAQAGEMKIVFENVKAGSYAISAIHDENENGELDSNFFGMPKEGFGFGNDAIGSFGPPSFEKATVTVPKQNISFAVSLRYL